MQQGCTQRVQERDEFQLTKGTLFLECLRIGFKGWQWVDLLTALKKGRQCMGTRGWSSWRHPAGPSELNAGFCQETDCTAKDGCKGLDARSAG
jgi:hypothetical protein